MYSMYVVIAYCFHCIFLYPYNVKKHYFLNEIMLFTLTQMEIYKLFVPLLFSY